jgi:mono/diheme cytochrome c family protein
MSTAGSARAFVLATACVVVLFSAVREWPVRAQSALKVDFERDVQPILQQRCIGCHGPTQQMGGFRLDGRRAALAGAVRPVIIPGSSESSRLYRRIIGPEFGTQMPPTGPLSQQEIDTLKTWIDQGAEWPDVLANDVSTPHLIPVHFV